jgi:hypothetical protein
MIVTQHLLEFRDVCRRIWNENCMRSIEVAGGSFEFEWTFSEIEVLLFKAIVLYRICERDRDEDVISPHILDERKALRSFRVSLSKDSCPVEIRDDQIGFSSWDYPVKTLSCADAELVFVHFFDHAGMDSSREYEYFECEITSSSAYPEIVGRRALVLVQDAQVEYLRLENEESTN